MRGGHLGGYRRLDGLLGATNDDVRVSLGRRDDHDAGIREHLVRVGEGRTVLEADTQHAREHFDAELRVDGRGRLA